jgi:quinol monooxygenase YgiN
VFVEEWADRDALRAHFAVPASRAFVEAAMRRVTTPRFHAVERRSA